jgi:hypothetical protein
VSSTRRLTTILLCLAALAAAGLGGATAGRAADSPSAATLDVRARFATQIASITRGTDIRVLLPRAVPFGNGDRTLYLAGLHHPDRWSVTIVASPSCGVATACFVASFAGRRGGALARPNLRLPGGQRARYVPIRCGASCGPAMLSFLHRDVLYDWRLKEPPAGGAAALARLAGDAIAATRP